MTSKLEVWILSLSNIGYKDGSIGGLSCDVDVDEDEDVATDVDFEQLEEVFLYLTYLMILSWGIDESIDAS